MVTQSHTSLQYKAIVCVIIYDLLLPAGIKVFKYFSQIILLYRCKILDCAKKTLLVENFHN